MAQYKGAAREGHRAQTLLKRREKQKEQLELIKQKISQDFETTGSVPTIKDKFASHFDAVEQELKSSTIGLVTLDQMRAKQQTLVDEHEKRIATETKSSDSGKLSKKRKKEKEKIKKASTLSFDIDDDGDEDEEKYDICDRDEEPTPGSSTGIKKARFGKNPHVDTSFLPDRDREEEEKREREKLRQEWVEKQEKIKKEVIEITYSYWDGSGHRRTCKMTKGNTIQQFLQRCLVSLRNEFTELKASGVEHLMYVKEDLIIPQIEAESNISVNLYSKFESQHYTFYDFIVTKARGKSGPLFNFDVHDDVRLINDATVEKDESHAGKVVLRSWYEKNKHIFPASRWEPYDPEKKWDKYTEITRITDALKKNARDQNEQTTPFWWVSSYAVSDKR